MLSLHIAAYGDEKIRLFVAQIQEFLRSWVKKQKTQVVHNSKNIERAEAQPKLLTIYSSVTLPTNKYSVSAKFSGILKVNDFDALYSELFSSIPHTPYPKTVSFEFSGLASKVQQIQKSHKKAVSSPYDFEISYRYERANATDELCIVDWSVFKSLDSMSVYKDFTDLIAALDVSFPDILMSAYINDICGDIVMNVHYGDEWKGTKILNIGKAFYVGDKIRAANGIADCDDTELFSKEIMTNGVFYALNDIKNDLDYTLAYSVPFIEKLLTPQYAVCNWSTLSTKEYFSPFPFDTASVYVDDSISDRDPTIIISYGYSYDQINRLPMLTDSHICTKRFVR